MFLFLKYILINSETRGTDNIAVVSPTFFPRVVHEPIFIAPSHAVINFLQST